MQLTWMIIREGIFLSKLHRHRNRLKSVAT